MRLSQQARAVAAIRNGRPGAVREEGQSGRTVDAEDPLCQTARQQQIDAPVAQLVLDLEARGLLNRTLIVLASEFSRDALIEGKPDKTVKDQVEVPEKIEDPKFYGMHRHFTDAGASAKGYVHDISK